MRDLTKEEREYFERLLKTTPQKSGGYYRYKDWKSKKNYKRSRILAQLHINKKLESWEIVHHKDENKLNDLISNLEVINTKEFNHHTSIHHAGKRDRKKTKGHFYQK